MRSGPGILFLLCRMQGFLTAVFFLLSCSSPFVRMDQPRGVYHLVKSGETLSAIARAYKVGVQELAEMNNIERPDHLPAGSVLFIPSAEQVVDDVLALSGRTAAQAPQEQPVVDKKRPAEGHLGDVPDKAKPPEGRSPKQKEKTPPAARPARPSIRTPAPGPAQEERALSGEAQETVKFDRKRFVWPVKGRLTGRFGTESVTAEYNGRRVETARIVNNGIKISAESGSPVRAAADGKVIYSMKLEKFGHTIIIEHADDFKTVYYDLGKRVVETGRLVKAGETIGYLDENNTDPHLSFEIRKHNKPRNPLFFLP